MNKRINWIDWGKTIAAFAVVYGHLPQSPDDFYLRYIQATNVSLFFFISGYLKKDRGTGKESWRKYWYSLILPYFLYNIIIYPYWLIKYYMQNGSIPDLIQAVKPIIGTLLLQHNSSFAEPLDGPLWYLPAILMMHLTIDWCRKTKHMHQILISLCIISFFLYAANKYWYFAPNLTPMGIMRNLPFYYIGYVMGRNGSFNHVNKKHDVIYCVCCLTLSLLLFQWHLTAYFGRQHILHIILFYPVILCFIFGVLHGCKALNAWKSDIIVNLSNGTLVIIGLHIILITCINFLLGHLLHINGIISYQWYEALLLTLLIIALLYPVILLGKRHIPVLLGRFCQQKI